jgi:hypothetical protein
MQGCEKRGEGVFEIGDGMMRGGEIPGEWVNGMRIGFFAIF